MPSIIVGRIICRRILWSCAYCMVYSSFDNFAIRFCCLLVQVMLKGGSLNPLQLPEGAAYMPHPHLAWPNQASELHLPIAFFASFPLRLKYFYFRTACCVLLSILFVIRICKRFCQRCTLCLMFWDIFYVLYIHSLLLVDLSHLVVLLASV